MPSSGRLLRTDLMCHHLVRACRAMAGHAVEPGLHGGEAGEEVGGGEPKGQDRQVKTIQLNSTLCFVSRRAIQF